MAVPGGVQVQLGDAYGDERRRVVFQLHIPRLQELGVAKVAEIRLRYTSLGEEIAAHEVTVPVTVNLVSADEAAAAEVDHEVTEEVVVLLSARAQEQAREHADRGEFDTARKLLGAAAAELRKMARTSKASEELIAQADELEQNREWMSGAMYTPASRKEMMYRSRESRQRRKRPPS